jgi:hypothetical protein
MPMHSACLPALFVFEKERKVLMLLLPEIHVVLYNSQRKIRKRKRKYRSKYVVTCMAAARSVTTVCVYT